MKRFEVTYRIEHHETYRHANSEHTILVPDDHDFRTAIMHHALERKYDFKLTYSQIFDALGHGQDEYGQIEVGDEVLYVWNNHDSLGFCVGWEDWGPERTDPSCYVHLVAVNSPQREATTVQQEAVSPRGGAREKRNMPPESAATVYRPTPQDHSQALPSNSELEAQRVQDRETAIINEAYPNYSRVTRVAKGTYRINRYTAWGDGLVRTYKVADSKFVKVDGGKVIVLS